jgi:hypothetical protein
MTTNAGGWQFGPNGSKAPSRGARNVCLLLLFAVVIQLVKDAGDFKVDVALITTGSEQVFSFRIPFRWIRRRGQKAEDLFTGRGAQTQEELDGEVGRQRHKDGWNGGYVAAGDDDGSVLDPGVRGQTFPQVGRRGPFRFSRCFLCWKGGRQAHPVNVTWTK